MAEHPPSERVAAVEGAGSRGSASSHPQSRRARQDGKGTETVTAFDTSMLNDWECWGARLLTWKTS